jgi:hypothetical protein
MRLKINGKLKLSATWKNHLQGSGQPGKNNDENVGAEVVELGEIPRLRRGLSARKQKALKN